MKVKMRIPKLPSIKVVWRTLAPYADDILTGLGLLVAVITTFLWSTIAGGYSLAAAFVCAGVVLARQQPKRR